MDFLEFEMRERKFSSRPVEIVQKEDVEFVMVRLIRPPVKGLHCLGV